LPTDLLSVYQAEVCPPAVRAPAPEAVCIAIR
jgi:hypothetical protein